MNRALSSFYRTSFTAVIEIAQSFIDHSHGAQRVRPDVEAFPEWRLPSSLVERRG